MNKLLLKIKIYWEKLTLIFGQKLRGTIHKIFFFFISGGGDNFPGGQFS